MSARILLVSSTFPGDATKIHGVYKRLDLLIDALRSLGTLHLLFFVEPFVDVTPEGVAAARERLAARWGRDFDLELVRREEMPERLSRWEAYGAPVFDAFRANFRWASGTRQLDALDRALETRPDLLFVHRMTAMGPVLRTSRPLPPVVFDLDDIEHRALARSIRQPPLWPGKVLRYLQVPALWWTERRAARLAARTFVCSEADRAYLARSLGADGIRVIPNAVEMPPLLPVPDEPRALFLGSLSYGPNRNAASYLMREIWPRVRRHAPRATLTIAGPKQDAVPGHENPPDGVSFAGFVDDLEALYTRHRVVCTPIHSGSGTRIKIIEAAAHSRAIVSTTLGAEGLDLEDGRQILLRDDPDAFATAVAELMEDDERTASLGRAARAAVLDAFDHDRVVERIASEIAPLLAPPPAA